MLPNTDPSLTNAWRALKAHFSVQSALHMRDHFLSDPTRAARFSIQRGDVLFDYSKHRIDQQTMELLDQLARECSLDVGIEAMFGGDKINETEGRAVLHTALRDTSEQSVMVDGQDVKPYIQRVKSQMRSFTQRVLDGSHKGAGGKEIRSVVNIGIGGSDLGPYMVTEALQHYAQHLDVRFVSNVDATHLVEQLKGLDPETTLFVIASKTFTTQETMTNAYSARAWLLDHFGNDDCIGQHFVAVSTNLEEVKNFGIREDNMFVFWDWVGGRFSLWSAIGLSIMLAIGPDLFDELLLGANDIDRHVIEEKEKSIPGRMALLSIWYSNFFGASSHAILPYDQYLHRFPAYLQQGDMESNGKSMSRTGKKVDYQTGTIIWGEPGTNGQHAFYQLIHQGTHLIPCDFIAFAESLNPVGDHHQKLIANCFAQSMALMTGKSEESIVQELIDAGRPQEEVERLAPYKGFEGNRPSSTFLFKKLTPFTLGQLIALYEHKILIEGLILNIYSFDQWGVELGKQLARPILATLKEEKRGLDEYDGSTQQLIDFWRNLRQTPS